ncbi:hypothetical protein FGIG_00584 [Fasciola gigantica]|uniref:Uncharacterized protein n=1 Tax=Fasciola gigantica TaxID=46835 RepID=A0A504YA30_FASGI|nr:hypothetical protein FGIG_00584 [Fasciola gigantica]
MELMTKVGRITNDRPLVQNSSGTCEYAVLTPNYLLLGSRNASSDESETKPCKLNRRWRQAQHLTEMFWSRVWARIFFFKRRVEGREKKKKTQFFFSFGKFLILGGGGNPQKVGRNHERQTVACRIALGTCEYAVLTTELCL